MENFIYDKKEEKFYLPDNEISYQDFFEKQTRNTLGFNIKYKDKYVVNLSENSKIITFEDFDKAHKIFISNENQVLHLIRLFGFDKYIVLKEGVEMKKISLSLNFDTIKRVKNYLKTDEFNKANRTINEPNFPLNLLSILYDKYQKFNVSSQYFELTEERKEFFKAIKNLLDENNFICICGPKSIGKTTSLLYFRKKYILSSFYINLTYCKRLFDSNDMEELYLVICKELFYCLNFDEVNKVYSFLENRKFESLMNMISELIKYLLEKIKQKKIYIIIDQYKEKFDPGNKIIQEIKNLILSSNSLNIIVCNSLNEKDFRKALQLYLENPENFFLNYLFVSKLITVPTKEINGLTKEEKALLEECGNLYEFYYKIKQNNNKLTMRELKEIIIKEIAEEIKEYYEKTDSNEISNKIKKLNLYINKNISFDKLSEISNFFPLKYFKISIDSKNIFIITDIQNNSEIVFNFSYPIVIDSLIKVYYSNKNSDNINIIDSPDTQKDSLELEKNFNEFLWITRFKIFYKGCQIKELIKISSIIKIKKEDKKTYNSGISYLAKKDDSILITQKDPNAQYFDTGILKCLNKTKKKYELFLFQEIICKVAKERLCEILLKSLKYYLKLLFKTELNIDIEDVYFSYVFKGENIDKIIINYCFVNQINYLIYDEKEIKIEDSNIDNKINLSFHYLQYPENKIQDKIELKPFEIDLSKANKKIINDEFNKLDNYLQKKRNNKKKSLELIKSKLDIATKFDKTQFRKSNYQELLLDEELIENENIIGISYTIDNSTNSLLKKINLSEVEKRNFIDLVKHFGENLKILSVTLIKDLSLDWIPSFRCAVLTVDKKKNKFYYDIANKKLYNLKTKKETENFNTNSDCYMVIFSKSNMIV